ncbi:sigma-54-dependent Fis family transcriptional regulator [Rhodopila sp.]|uniref:sigma-54-dependent Fis family transcriptional regulator n=1 Tax=Rhodopila sp. TaxID=2480087 RepID=UPI003D0A7AE2
MLTSADEKAIGAHDVQQGGGITDAVSLRPLISDSWQRCLAAGLDPRTSPPLLEVGGHALAQARDATGAVRRLVLAELELLYQQIAGTNHMVAFASPSGLLLDTIADATFQDAAHAARIAAGTVWQETACGTNALGTTALLGKPVTVHGAEHFFIRHRKLTCTAAPILDPDGNLAGVLDASSDYRSRQQHTRALVAMAAAQIENSLLRERHGNQMLIAFHGRAEYLHTLSAGLLAVDPDGCILAANGQARYLLHGLPATRGRHFNDVFRTRLNDVFDAARDGARTRIEDRVGSIHAARVENAPSRGVAQVGMPRRIAAAAFVTDDPAITVAVTQIERAAVRRVPVLIRGATGTGKEQFARHAHAASGRHGRFVPVNCAALPETLAEAELFGYVEGAFTGARRGGAPGLIVEAERGTLFLDEIGDMKPSLQALLLRFLDDWTVRAVGGGQSRTVDVLLVSATNIDIAEAVAEKRFRPDLFYRLGGIEVALPPLSHRSDFGAIATATLADIDPRLVLKPEAIDALIAAPWPGNIRQLRSVLTRMTLSASGAVITGEDVAAALDGAAIETAAARRRVRETLVSTSGNISEAARRLGVSRNTIYRALGGRDSPR